MKEKGHIAQLRMIESNAIRAYRAKTKTNARREVL